MPRTDVQSSTSRSDNNMANGNTQTQMDSDSRYAQLGERVSNLSTRQHDLETEMRRGFGEVSQAVNLLSNELRGSSRTQWPVIWSAVGVCFVVIAAIGGLAYSPVLGNISRIDNSQQSLAALIKSVDDNAMPIQAFAEFKNTYENNRVLSRQDYNDRFGVINEALKDTVPRAEHARVWSAYDQRFLDQQRQIDEVKTAQGSVYGTRDLLIDLRNRLDRVETLRESVTPR